MLGHDPLDELSEGISDMPRRKTSRERLTDILYIQLQISSRLLLFVLAIVGYWQWNLLGLTSGGISGFFVGRWMRYSMGLRGPNPDLGFFTRKCERADGSRRGMLEWILETLRGNDFDQSKCRKICDAFRESQHRMAAATSDDERDEILQELNRRVKEYSYD